MIFTVIFLYKIKILIAFNKLDVKSWRGAEKVEVSTLFGHLGESFLFVRYKVVLIVQSIVAPSVL